MGATAKRAASFDELYATTYARLLSYCRRRVASAADVDDVVAETYLVAWRRLEDALGADSQIAWLYAIAYRVLANQRRTVHRRGRLSGRIRSHRTPVTTADPAVAATDNAAVQAVYAALADLDPGDQELIRLAAFEELNHAEIAIVLGIRAGAVRSRLFRARQRLKEAMNVPARRDSTPMSDTNISDDTERSPKGGQL